MTWMRAPTPLVRVRAGRTTYAARPPGTSGDEPSRERLEHCSACSCAQNQHTSFSLLFSSVHVQNCSTTT